MPRSSPNRAFPVEYIASYDRPGAGTDLAWTLRSRDRLRVAVAEIEPDVVLFDGTHPYERLLPALRSTGARLVWCRRALWREDADTAPLHRSHLFDAVLEPGELGNGGELGPTAARRAEAEVVEPIVLLDRADLPSRDDAEAALGLEPGRRNVLVQLGQGAGVGEATARCLRHLVDRGDVQVAAISSALAGLDDVPRGVVRVRSAYPIARYLAAFDAAVAASGYNAAHELAALGVPALLVPMPRQTDDQAARAREAERAGLALAASGAGDSELETRLDELLEPTRHAELRARLDGATRWRGAEEAAAWIERGITGKSAVVGGGATGRRPSSAVRLRRAWIFAASVPRTLARVASQRLRRPRPRVLITAFGVAPERYEAELERAIATAGEPAENLLVVTDRLEFEALLRAGAGFEHVPAAGARQPELAGVPYERFRAARLALIRSRRPRPTREIELGQGSPHTPGGA